MLQRLVTVTIMSLLLPAMANAQDDYDEFRRKARDGFGHFSKTRRDEYKAFREQVNREYGEMLRQAWKDMLGMKAEPKPKEDKPVKPITCPDQDKKNTPIEKPIKDLVVPPAPKPQPEPVAPIEDNNTQTAPLKFTYCGTGMQLRLGQQHRFKLSQPNESGVAKAWEKLTGDDFTPVLHDCLQLRSQHKLCDWAYLCMLDSVATSFYGNTEEKTLFIAAMYAQSGYKMRFAFDSANKVVMLFASDYSIYDRPYWNIDGNFFYTWGKPASTSLRISAATYKGEQPLRLQIDQEPVLTASYGSVRTLRSKRYDDMVATVSTDRNLMTMFDQYPTAKLGEDFCTRWALYASMPLSRHAAGMAYPSLRKGIEGKSRLEAVNRILNWVQTAFVYEYDDKVWGGDRAFFADETLHYPFCDCEDRSILFSRLVRDLLDMDVVLIYYPGHLATAVYFPEGEQGDFVSVAGRKYTICDPTYIGAPVGRTMPSMDNSGAKVVILR